MELKQITYFLSLAETLNFSEAAKRHNISQPALSKVIQRFEEDIGGALVHRDGKDTRLTELGRKLLTEFQIIRQSEERAREIAIAHARTGETHVRLGISNSLGPRPFAAFIANFLETHPDVRVTLHPVGATNTEDEILSGMLDACICAKPGAPNHKIKSTSLFEERLMAAMSQSHPLGDKQTVSIRDMAEFPYFDRLNCEFRPKFIETVTALDLDIDIAVQSDREDWIQELVATGHGMTSLAEHSRVVPGIKMRPFDDVDLVRHVSIVSILGSTGNEKVRKLENSAAEYDWNTAAA